MVVAVHWKFIPITAENSIKMSLLQTCVDAEHVRTFYKGAMLSDETLHRLGFANYYFIPATIRPADVSQ